MAGFFPSYLDALNGTVEDTFATESLLYLPAASASTPAAAVSIPCIPLDALRLEGTVPGNFTLRSVRLNHPNFVSNSINPTRGDLVKLANGETFVVDQVQEDTGGYARLILNRAGVGVWP